jgi:hypothetical protein
MHPARSTLTRSRWAIRLVGELAGGYPHLTAVTKDRHPGS